MAPASNAWTEFNVTDVDGTVRIAARKGDLTITDESGTVTLPQGQQTTRDEQSTQVDQTAAGLRVRLVGADPAQAACVVAAGRTMLDSHGAVVPRTGGYSVA